MPEVTLFLYFAFMEWCISVFLNVLLLIGVFLRYSLDILPL